MTGEAKEWIPLFPDEEVPCILDAVLRCCARIRKKMATELENHLSDRLRQYLDQDTALRRRPVELDREVPIYDRHGKRPTALGRGDIRFLYSTGSQKPWPYFLIEAKRLHVTFPSGWQSLVSEYVTGEQGMRCFIEGRYACDLGSGAMLGYVFDGAIDRARTAVTNLISANRAALKLGSPFNMKRSEILKDDTRIHETTHSLRQGSFIIYHVFVTV